jgi:hypothetical protein
MIWSVDLLQSAGFKPNDKTDATISGHKCETHGAIIGAVGLLVNSAVLAVYANVKGP